MPLPSSFSKTPGQDPHSYFRNICIELKKTINTSKDVAELQKAMNDFVNASRQMTWKRQKHHIYERDKYEKTASKVFSEFSRYLEALQKKPKEANPQDLLDALDEVDILIKSQRVI